MTHSVFVTNRSHFDGDLYSYPRFTRAASESVITTDDASQAVYIFVDLVVCPSLFCSNSSDIYLLGSLMKIHLLAPRVIAIVPSRSWRPVIVLFCQPVASMMPSDFALALPDF